LAIAGPTAVGKTAVGCAVAARVFGEIISADSVAVYRGFDIGTAKPTVEERAACKFHLIDVADARDAFSVAQFCEMAERAEQEIRAAGHVPVLVGGTGLYQRCFLERMGLSQTAADPEVRERLTAWADEHGLSALHARLTEIDPISAARIHTNDRVRMIRAMEVFERTGRPISEWQAEDAAQRNPRPSLKFGLRCQTAELRKRIEARIQSMLNQGLIEEVRGLLQEGYPTDLSAMQSVGYREAVACAMGEIDLETAEAMIVQSTVKFAKRQMTWFRADKEIHWIDVDDRSIEEISNEIVHRFTENWQGIQYK
jgi:tRNA dimethylallyltransferase